jgi:hypothetical protein
VGANDANRYLFFMLAVLRKGGSDRAGGHGNDAESCDEHEACENASAKRDGGWHRHNRRCCEVQNEAEQPTLVINHGKCLVLWRKISFAFLGEGAASSVNDHPQT